MVQQKRALSLGEGGKDMWTPHPLCRHSGHIGLNTEILPAASKSQVVLGGV